MNINFKSHYYFCRIGHVIMKKVGENERDTSVGTHTQGLSPRRARLEHCSFVVGSAGISSERECTLC